MGVKGEAENTSNAEMRHTEFAKQVTAVILSRSEESPDSPTATMSSHSYYVYILASRSKVLYTGVTNDLERRVAQHRTNTGSRFSARYNADRLVWFDETNDISTALTMEKKIKGWVRDRKIALIEDRNPGWRDLASEWGLPGRSFVTDSG